jgi:uncharacterized protein (TIGR02466 family)
MYETLLLFPTNVYKTEATHLIEEVVECVDYHLQTPETVERLEENLLLKQSGNFFNDARMENFCHFVAHRCWKILEDQGCYIEPFLIHFSEMWAQEYPKHAYMEPHTHAMGSVLTGFYFLEVPEGAPNLVFYDPRPGKVQANFSIKESKEMLYVHDKAQMPVKAGDLIISNPWLPHGFSPHKGEKPLKMVHFNVVLQAVPNNPPAEVI